MYLSGLAEMLLIGKLEVGFVQASLIELFIHNRVDQWQWNCFITLAMSQD